MKKTVKLSEQELTDLLSSLSIFKRSLARTLGGAIETKKALEKLESKLWRLLREK